MGLRQGAIFAGFKVVAALGSGGMSEVYLVEHPRLPRQEALKILSVGTSQDADYRARFNREAELASKLWHPNIVALHDRGEVDGQLWISMDYVRGRDAADLARSYPAGVPLTEATAIAEAVASALDYAHGCGMLHRDVKPANILLGMSDHAGQRILLADFGIARNAGDIDGLTATNTTVGTVAYAAPEQLLGANLDGRADQYALAATIFHLLAGTPPFVDSNPAVVIGKHLSAVPPRLSQFRPDLAWLDPVFERALAKTPSDRYPTCSDFSLAITGRDAGTSGQLWPPAFPQQAPIPAAVAAMSAVPTQFAVPTGVSTVGAGRSSTRGTVVAVATMIVLLMMLAGAGVFAAIQWRRPAPVVTREAQWQPYVDFGKTFAERMIAFDPQTSDAAFDWVADNSTGEFRKLFEAQRPSIIKSLTDSGYTTTANVTSSGVKSVNHQSGTAVILVAASSTTTDRAGVKQDPKRHQLVMSIERIDGAFKASKIEFVS